MLVPDGTGLGIGATWNWDRATLPGSGAEETLARYLEAGGRIIELDAVRSEQAEPVELASVPQWMLDTDAWDATCAERFAHALKDLGEEAPDIVARRKKGGEFCGVMVKSGRRKFVVGPDDQAIRLVFAPDGVKPGDGGYLASQFMSADVKKHAEILSFPSNQLPDRIEARLREYAKTSAGFHEGLAMALAGDLKVEVGDVVAAAKADTFRFDVYLGAAGSESQEIVRLLLKDQADGAKADDASVAEG